MILPAASPEFGARGQVIADPRAGARNVAIELGARRSHYPDRAGAYNCRRRLAFRTRRIAGRLLDHLAYMIEELGGPECRGGQLEISAPRDRGPGRQ